MIIIIIIIIIIVIIIVITYLFVYFKFYSVVSGFDQVFHFKILSNFFSVIFFHLRGSTLLSKMSRWLRKHVLSRRCGIFCEA